MFPKLFKITPNGVAINKDEIALYKPINKLITRDKGSAGDSDGRKKLMAIKELTYLYFYCNPESSPNRLGQSDKEKHEYAIKHAELPNTFVVHDDLKEAIKCYNEELASCLSLELINNARKAIGSSNKALSILASRVEKRITNVNNDSTDEELNEIIKMSNNILEMLDDIPNMVAKLEKAENLVYDQITRHEEKRGGGEIPSTYENDN